MLHYPDNLWYGAMFWLPVLIKKGWSSYKSIAFQNRFDFFEAFIFGFGYFIFDK